MSNTDTTIVRVEADQVTVHGRNHLVATVTHSDGREEELILDPMKTDNFKHHMGEWLEDAVLIRNPKLEKKISALLEAYAGMSEQARDEHAETLVASIVNVTKRFNAKNGDAV